MGVIVQTRFNTTYTTAMSSVQTTMDVADVPLRTVGYLTIRRLYSDLEDIKYTGVGGLTLTGLLRGLSPTALTDTEVVGLKKSHDLNSPASTNTVEMTNVHYIMNNKPNKDDPEEITGLWTFSSGFSTPEIFDDNLNSVLTFGTIASAVNNVRITNAAAAGTPIISVEGSDTNINLEILAKGTGYLTIPDGSKTKTTAAPVNPTDIVNKAYIDSLVNAPSTQYWPTSFIYREDLALNDVVEYRAGPSNQPGWYKASSGSAFNLSRQVGLVRQAGLTGATGLVLRSGVVEGLNFPNINPTISSGGTGGSIAIGDSNTRVVVALLVNNANNPDVLVTGVNLRIRKVGTPNALKVDLVLPNIYDIPTKINPAAYADSDGTDFRGAVINELSIPQSSVTTVFSTVAASFPLGEYLPANSYCFICLSQDQVDGSNYYEIERDISSPAIPSILTLNRSSNLAWDTQSGISSYSLTVSSQSALGRKVVMSNITTGAFGLSGSGTGGNWSPIIGRVTSATSMLFDPVLLNQTEKAYVNMFYSGLVYAATKVPLVNAPNTMDVIAGIGYDYTTDYVLTRIGHMGAVNNSTTSTGSTNRVGTGTFSGGTNLTFGSSPFPSLANYVAGTSNAKLDMGLMFLNGSGGSGVYTLGAVRTMFAIAPSAIFSGDGVYLYPCYTEGANFADYPVYGALSLTFN